MKLEYILVFFMINPFFSVQPSEDECHMICSMVDSLGQVAVVAALCVGGWCINKLQKKVDVQMRVMGALLHSVQGQRAAEKHLQKVLYRESDRKLLINSSHHGDREALQDLLNCI
jgi:hypothetical protein